MDPKQFDSYRRSINLYKNILLKTREKILEQSPSYLQPLPTNNLPNKNKMAVIIDPRYDDLMEAVILNFMHFMVPEGWVFTIASAEQYKEQIMQRFPQTLFMQIDNSLIYYDENKIPNISIDNYNKLLCSSEFWNMIPCNQIAIFQKDCIMYRMIPEDWIYKYDYSGAFWYTDETSLANGVINGGFSIRNKTAMLNCIKHITWDMIEVYRKNVYTCHEFLPVEKRNEDMFFTYACEILKYQLPPISIRKQLAIESEYFLGTCVFHGWTKVGYQIEELAIQILSTSPLFSRYVPEILAFKSKIQQTPQLQISNNYINPETTDKTALPIFIMQDKSIPEVPIVSITP